MVICPPLFASSSDAPNLRPFAVSGRAPPGAPGVGVAPGGPPAADPAVTVKVPVIWTGWTSQWKKYVPGLGAVNVYFVEEGPVMIGKWPIAGADASLPSNRATLWGVLASLLVKSITTEPPDRTERLVGWNLMPWATRETT